MDKADRIALIDEMRSSGKTLQEIGDCLSLSRERIRQICEIFRISAPIKKKEIAVAERKPGRKMLFGEARTGAIAQCGRDPYRAFRSHKSSAKQRGICFSLTFEQWWAHWKPYFHLRGRGRDSYQMCRYMDSGGYEDGNVFVKTARENGHEKSLVHRTKNYQRALVGSWYKRADLSSFHSGKDEESME